MKTVTIHTAKTTLSQQAAPDFIRATAKRH